MYEKSPGTNPNPFDVLQRGAAGCWALLGDVSSHRLTLPSFFGGGGGRNSSHAGQGAAPKAEHAN